MASAIWPGAKGTDNRAEPTSSWSFASLQTPAKTPADRDVMDLTGEPSDDSDGDSSVVLLDVSPKHRSMTRAPTPTTTTKGQYARIPASGARSQSGQGRETGMLADRKRDASSFSEIGEYDGRREKRRRGHDEGLVREPASTNPFWDGIKKQVRRTESSTVATPGQSPAKPTNGSFQASRDLSNDGANKQGYRSAIRSPTKVTSPRTSRAAPTAVSPGPVTAQPSPTKVEAPSNIKRESTLPQQLQSQTTLRDSNHPVAVNSRSCPFMIEDDDDDDNDDNNDNNNDRDDQMEKETTTTQPPEPPPQNSFEMPPPQLQIHKSTYAERAAEQARSARLRQESLQRKRERRAESVAFEGPPHIDATDTVASLERPRCAGSVPPSSANDMPQPKRTSTTVQSRVGKSNVVPSNSKSSAEQSKGKAAVIESPSICSATGHTTISNAVTTAARRHTVQQTSGRSVPQDPYGVLAPLSASTVPSKTISAGDGTAFDPYATRKSAPRREVTSNHCQPLPSIEKLPPSGSAMAADPHRRLEQHTPAAMLAQDHVREINSARPPQPPASVASPQNEVPKTKVISPAEQQRKDRITAQLKANREDAEREELRRKNAEKEADEARRESAANARKAADARREQEARDKEDKKRQEEEKLWQEAQNAKRIALSRSENAQTLSKHEADEATARQKSLSSLPKVFPMQKPPSGNVQEKRAHPPSSSSVSANGQPSIQSPKSTHDARRQERIEAAKQRNERRREADQDDEELIVEPEVETPQVPAVRPLKAQANHESNPSVPPSQAGPVSLNSSAGQARLSQSKDTAFTAITPADLEMMKRREDGMTWTNLEKVSEGIYNRFRGYSWLWNRYKFICNAIATANVSQTLFDKAKKGDRQALDEINQTLGFPSMSSATLQKPDQTAPTRISVKDTQRSAQTSIEDSFRAYPSTSLTPNPDLRHVLEADSSDDAVDASSRPTTSGKRLLDSTALYYLRMQAELYDEQIRDQQHRREPSPLTTCDYVHWAYNVQRREISAEEVEDGLDIEDKDWVFCDEEFECMQEANDAASMAVTRFVDKSFPRGDLSKGHALYSNSCPEGMQYFEMTLDAGGSVQTQVTRYQRTYEDGIPPTTKEDWLPRQFYSVHLHTIEKSGGNDLFTQATRKDTREILDNNGYTSLELANEAAAKHFVHATYRPTTIHLNRRDKEIKEQVEELLAGLDHEEGEMFRKEAEEKDGSVKRTVYVQSGNLIGPRN